MRLKDKVVVVTGGSTGIGLASVKKFVAEGAKVVLGDINVEDGEREIASLKAEGHNVLFVKTDVSKNSEVINLVEKAVEAHGTIDVMFNNAGIGIGSKFLDHQPEVDYDPIISVNQHGIYYGLLAAAKKMVELGVKGVIINTASAFSFVPGELTFAYNTSKAAVKMMTQSAALELAPNGIRVVCIAPGRVNTRILQPYRDMGIMDKVNTEQMRYGLTEPEEVANVVAFLATEEANCINGSCVKVDDGYTEYKSTFVINQPE